jgi:hypothetical protein
MDASSTVVRTPLMHMDYHQWCLIKVNLHATLTHVKIINKGQSTCVRFHLWIRAPRARHELGTVASCLLAVLTNPLHLGLAFSITVGLWLRLQRTRMN